MNTDNQKRIYFEDESFAVIYKHIGEDSQTFFKSLFPHKPFAAAVSRLDIPVSGLSIIAFSPHIQTALSYIFKMHQIRKEYWAVCEQNSSRTVTADYQRLEHCIGFHTRSKKAFIAGKKTKARVKKAVLCWRCCGCGKRYDFIQVLPETGRTHQIRVQLSAIGRPIKGDIKYGAKRSEKNGGIRLHCFGLSFLHPATGLPLQFEAMPSRPDALWKDCIAACRTIST